MQEKSIQEVGSRVSKAQRIPKNEPIPFKSIHISLVFLLPMVLTGVGGFFLYRDSHYNQQLADLERINDRASIKFDVIFREHANLVREIAILKQRSDFHEHEAPPPEWRAQVRENEKRINSCEKQLVAFAKVPATRAKHFSSDDAQELETKVKREIRKEVRVLHDLWDQFEARLKSVEEKLKRIGSYFGMSQQGRM